MTPTDGVGARRSKMGGKRTLRVLLAAHDDVRNALLSRTDGGGTLDQGLRERVRERSGGAIAVEVLEVPYGRSDLLLQQQADIVVFSIRPEVVGSLPVSRFKDNFVHLIHAVKERLDAHVVVLNGSSFDPNDQVHDYHGVDETVALRIHAFNLALAELSALEGISIVDADRLIAELGGGRHVVRPFAYSPEACAAVGEEFVRVLADIGFFEERPLVVQVGRRGA